MIRKLAIENYKSIEELESELGRVNVLIGENGSGKSNVLEAIAFASAASQDKLDNEFLSSRGIRVTDPRFTRAAFGREAMAETIHIELRGDSDLYFECILQSEESTTHARWVNTAFGSISMEEDFQFTTLLIEAMRKPVQDPKAQRVEIVKAVMDLEAARKARLRDSAFSEFLIYSPENTALRVFQAEGQILPLGIKGEGLFAHLKALTAEPHRERLSAIMEKLELIDWFERFDIPSDLGPGEHRIRIGDRYLGEGALFDQRSANEGFLFLLFYFTLFISPDTPAFFAIDNVDASLNPKLCSELTRELIELAKTHNKQAILTTHNPAVLDGLDLHDDEQRLFVVHRNKSGHTKMRRILPLKPIEGEPPIRLSEAFLRGYLGGLPKNF